MNATSKSTYLSSLSVFTGPPQIVLLTFEVAILYSADGTELGRAKGNATSLKLSDKHKELVRGGILTHNHPDGGFFSENDVRITHELDLTELRAVSRRDPVEIFSMRRPDSGWDLQAYDGLMEAEEKRITQLHNRPHIPWLSAEQSDEIDAILIEQIRLAWIELFPSLLDRLGLTYSIMPLQKPNQTNGLE